MTKPRRASPARAPVRRRHSQATSFFVKQREIATSVSALLFLLGTLITGIVWLTGGSLPPWLTPAAADKREKDLRTALMEYVDESVAAVRAEMKAQKTEHDQRDARNECEDYNGRFYRAQQAIKMEPDNAYYSELYNSTSAHLMTIPDCKPMILSVPTPQR